MDKTISIVNDNLRQVINGIREHLENSKKHLANIDSEMNEKVNLAQKYKETVVESKDKINTLEDEISSLEKDLDDLNTKFGGTDFKEILSAGNKEINSKIIEKRAIVQKESQKILDLTNKARDLKEELIKLKEKKRTVEKDIKNTTVVEKFYAAKVNEIIDYTEAGNDLELYVDNTPQAELMSNNDYQREFVEVSKVLNDHVFEEIDEITLKDPDEDLVEQALKNVVSNTYDSNAVQIDDIKEALEKDLKEEIKSEPKEEVFEEVKAEPTVVPEVTVEETKAEELTVVPEETIEETKVEEPTVVPEVVEEVSVPVQDGIEEKSFQAITTEDLTKKEIVEEVKADVSSENLIIDMDNPFNDTASDDEQEAEEEIKQEESEEDSLNALIEKTLNNMNYPSFDAESIDLNLLEDDVTEEPSNVLPGEVEVKSETLLPGEEPSESDSIEIDIEDDEDEKSSNDSRLSNEDLSLLGLDTYRLSDDDLYNLKKANIVDLKKTIGVLNRHNVSLDNVYSNIKVLDLPSEKIDKILTLLEQTNKPLDTVIPELDKIDENKLEESIDINKDKEIIDIIVPAIDNVSDVIKDKLNMSDEEYNTLKTSVSEETLKKLNLLSKNVVDNYSVLNTLGIENIRECLTKYPSKLMLDTKEFKNLLDKYDQDDLVRCINKNAKVFDKI